MLASPGFQRYREYGSGALTMFDVYLNDRRDLLIVRIGSPIPLADGSGRCRKKKKTACVSDEIKPAVQSHGYYMRKLKEFCRG